MATVFSNFLPSFLPSFSLKREMRRVVLRDCGLDALTVALAFAYFETLVLRGAINKANRE